MPDQTLSKKMEVMSRKAIEDSQNNHGVKLDYSEDSVQKVESILAKWATKIPRNIFSRLFKRGPSESEITRTYLKIKKCSLIC